MNIYLIKFDGLWMGGKAVVKAYDKTKAYEIVKKEWPNIEPIEKCRITKFDMKPGLVYFDSGDY